MAGKAIEGSTAGTSYSFVGKHCFMVERPLVGSLENHLAARTLEDLWKAQGSYVLRLLGGKAAPTLQGPYIHSWCPSLGTQSLSRLPRILCPR